MLWKNPKLIYKILKNCELKDIKDSLASFIVDNFYNNYLSGNYVENNLLYIFALMLKDEVDKLDNIEQVFDFLDNSVCGFLLEQLKNKIDVQIYFKKIIFGTISKIENYSSRKINFNVNEIKKKLSWLRSEKFIDNNADILKNAKNAFKFGNKSVEMKGLEENFLKNFLIDINASYLEKLLKNDNIQKNPDLNAYYEKLIEDIKKCNNQNLYSNSYLISNFMDSNSPTDILAIYKEQAMEIISFINKLIEDLSANTFLIPYSVKCICKIIHILIKNKFKNIRKVEINSFISKFFLGKLLIPIISSPSDAAYITDFVISENTLKNIAITNIIISKLFSGNLFISNPREGNFTSLNKFFLEKMPQILLFYQKAIDVKLPAFINDLLQNKLAENFEYDFFEQNKEGILANISIFFNLNHLIGLINGIKKSPDFFESSNSKDKTDEKLEKFNLIYNKLNKKETIQNIKSLEEKIINNYLNKLQMNMEVEKKKKDKNKKDKQSPPQEIECYFLFLEDIIEKKYEYIFAIEDKASDYYIDLRALLKTKKLTNEEKILINVKNYLCATLGNYRVLNISDISQENKKSTIKILEEIKNHINLPNFILNSNTVPSEWYLNSLLDNLSLLEKSYKNSDFLKLYKELYNDLSKSIESLNFHFLIIFRNRIKFIDRAKDYYETIENSAKNIIINEKIKSMVENNFLPVEVQFKYDDDDEDVFKIKFSNLKEKNFENKLFLQDTKKNSFTFQTIESFASNFPNLVGYQIFQDENPLEIISKLNMANSLKEYFQLIREKFIKKNLIEEKDYDTLYKNKISEYFMNKIYEKIYPIEPQKEDSDIFKKATKLSWVEPNTLLNKDYIYETSLPDILHQFQNLNTARTPQKKFECIKKILELINNLIIFNEGDKKDISLDDITPPLFYIFIKAHPFKIFTDLEFIKTFLDIKNGVYSFHIKQIESAINILLNCDEKNFGLSKEEFNKRCNMVANNSNNNSNNNISK